MKRNYEGLVSHADHCAAYAFRKDFPLQKAFGLCKEPINQAIGHVY
jgi:hypothetical protein